MDCETFQNSEIDALYSEGEGRELDSAASAAMSEHAATCASCGARFSRLRGLRARVLAVAIEPVATDFESRIMAAVDAGLANRATPPPAEAALAAAAKPEGGAKIFRFMSRPSFAVAATFVLVIGAAAVLMTRGSTKNAPMSTASQERSPAARAASANDSTPAASAMAMATATVAPLVAAAPALPGAMADESEGRLAFNAPPSPSPTSAPFARKAGPGKPTEVRADDPGFASAKTLANAGRCGEALPKLEALKANVPEAELYAARCIAKTSGCAVAASRFDTAAQRNAGTETGSRATIEGAKCYQANGELGEARKRFVAARDEGTLEAEASNGLDALDRGAPATGAGAAPHGGHAAPKAARPAPAPPAEAASARK